MSFTGLNKLNLPNAITLFRLISVVPVVALLSLKSEVSRRIAAFVFLLASFSDLADGFIARSTGQVTNLGRLADPIADKILLTGALLPLVASGDIPSWLSVIIISREFMVTGLRALAAVNGRILAADFLGKMKTIIYTFALFFIMLSGSKIGLALLYIGALVAVLSGIKYFRENLDLVR